MADDRPAGSVSFTIPTPICRDDYFIAPLPANWARFIGFMQFICGRGGNIPESPLLQYLANLPVLRELVFRSSQIIDGPAFFDLLSNSLPNIEASHMQMSGVAPHTACTCCRQDHGMFNQCVVLPAHETIKHCANCHMDGNGAGCSFTTSVSGPGAPFGLQSNGPVVPMPMPSFDYNGQPPAAIWHEVQQSTNNRGEQVHYGQPGRNSHPYPIHTNPPAYETLFGTQYTMRRPQEESRIQYVYRQDQMSYEMRREAHYPMRYPQEESRLPYVRHHNPLHRETSMAPATSYSRLGMIILLGYESRRGAHHATRYLEDELLYGYFEIIHARESQPRR